MDVLAAVHAARGVRTVDADPHTVATGYLCSLPDSAGLCVVSVHGSEPIYGVPATPGLYDGCTTVRILLRGGRPVQVLGPAGSPVIGGSAGETAGAPASTEGTTQMVQRTITPIQSGTWRVARASWARWGDAADVYQGSTAESGRLWGLACYGDQVVAMRASRISGATLTLGQVTSTGYSGPWGAQVQGSASGTLPAGIPTYSGPTVSVEMPGRGVAGERTVDLPAEMCESIRTGATRSLGLTGATYGGSLGLGRAGSAWALSIIAEIPR